ncbi:MAG TPA: fused MFS/spermidine synthase [Albitalea sp.]|nr:fused MFS/spermidine synthase [Albitalea sp.]
MRFAPLALMIASGFAGLGYQLVWTQQCALWLGHESAAVLAVVAAFFGGLALGAFVAGPRIECSAHPLRWYVACELLIAVWGGVLTALMAPASDALLALAGTQPAPAWQWAVAFGGSFGLLLPATAAMGATLPAMERVVAQMRSQGRSIAALYASNTFGALLGVLASAFWLVPELGLARTAGLCIALNLLCATVAWVALPRAAQLQRADAPASLEQRVALARLAITGLLGIGYEVLVVRVLSQVAEDTVYTFAMLLAVYLVGSALGAAAYARWRVRHADAQALGDRLLCALAAACLLGTASLWAAEQIKDAFLHGFGASMAAAVGAEAALALAAFALPTIVMGALFSHLSERASASGVSFGRSLAANTLGAALAPLVCGVLLAPLIGPQAALLCVAIGYLLLVRPRSWRMPIAWAPAGVALALLIWAPPLAFVDVPEGGHVVSYQEGVMAAVSVVEDADGVAQLRINNRQQEGSSATRWFDARQALLPVLLHPSPQRALFLGLGTGVTAASAAEDPTLQVDAVELLPEVIAASRHFTPPNPRLHVMAADARRYVRATPQHYDVIVSDNFHPARSGSGALYTVEHFRAVRERLAAGGLFCQWLPLHQLDLPTLRSIVQSFIAVYPDASAVLASNSLSTPVLGLVGHRDPAHFDLDRVRGRLARAALPASPAAFGIEDEYALLGSFVAGPQALAHFAGDAAANTDDRPVVAYRAPRVTYAPESLPRDRLVALLDELSIAPAELIDTSADAGSARRLAAYWGARKRFVAAGRAVRPAADVREMLAQVREPLLAVLRVSPEFRPAYDPLLRMAATLANSDPAAARALLRELAALQPERPEAARLAASLGS